MKAVLVGSGDVDVVDEDGGELNDADGDETAAEDAAEEAEGDGTEGIVDCADGDENEDEDDVEEDVEEGTSDVLDRDERMPTLTPNGAVADALTLVWDVVVVLTLSGIDSVELEEVLETAVDMSELDEGTVVVIANVVDAVVESDDTRLEDEYNVAVDVEFTYSVVVEYIVIVVQVVGDCATARLIHAPVASKTVLFMTDLRREAAGCTRILRGRSGISRFYHGAWKQHRGSEAQR